MTTTGTSNNNNSSSAAAAQEVMMEIEASKPVQDMMMNGIGMTIGGGLSPLSETLWKEKTNTELIGDVSARLAWKDLTVMVTLGNGDTQNVLEGLTGYAEPGTFTALMGPSGSGKSTLLDALSGRLAANAFLSGNILLNGRKAKLSFGTAAYVTQDDNLIGTLTVRETISYSARLRLPDRMSWSEKRTLIESTIIEMGLQDFADTVIGNWHLRGISGGEKRRVSIAVEILMRPRLLFLDEPTSGLDSASAFFVTQTLRGLSRDGRTVIASIHQPSSEVFELFDRLYLLSGGKLVYFGQASQAYEFFAQAGFPCPALRNPSDHFLRCINSDFDKVKATLKGSMKLRFETNDDPLEKTTTAEAIRTLLEFYRTSHYCYSANEKVDDMSRIVRRLSACETMGSATTICSDKTGTLTLNQMAVVEACVGTKKVETADNKSILPPKLVSLLTEGIAQNTTGSVFMAEGGKDTEVSGSPTEKAILQWGLNIGMNFDAVRSSTSIIHAFPFNSEKKRGGVGIKLPDSEVHIHWKGAAEIVLDCCSKYMDENDEVKLMDEEKLRNFKKAIEDMAERSLRCVAIAYREDQIEVPTNEEELGHWQLPEEDLVLLAIVGIKDPCRPGVKEAVQLCTKAGVKVRMVTGDNLSTAKAIALECGILGSDADATEPNLIEGKAFRVLPEAQRLEIAEKISVMGRSSPSDKLLLVQALRKRGHVVAVTGDGTNDAPALHEADIGLAMGISGTEVAKESSDIIILDDNFASVVKVVRWGRSVYANIQKFIQFQLTVNAAALIINVVAAVSAGDVPLNAVQLLWVNLIMDTLGALALATEPPTDHLMDRPPVGRREPLVTNIMWRNLLIQALYQVIVLLVLNFGGKSLLHLEHENPDHANRVKNTLIFNAFVFCQAFNEFNARKPDEMNVFKGVGSNRLFMGIVGLTVVFQVLIIFFLGKFFSVVRLSWQLWLVSVAIGIFSWPLAVLGKFIPVPVTPLSELVKKMLCLPRH